jgi:hypothetical protein
MSVASVACQVWYLFGSTDSNVNLDALSLLLTTAAVCDLLVSGVSACKTLIDAFDGVRACRRHVLVVLFPAVVAEEPPPVSSGERLMDLDHELLEKEITFPAPLAGDADFFYVPPPLVENDGDELDGGISTWEPNFWTQNELTRMYTKIKDRDNNE